MGMHETGDETGEETGDGEARSRSATHLADGARTTADPRLRTFRTGSDLPFLVLHDERRGGRPLARDDAALT